MPRNQKSAADQVAEAKAKAAGIPYVKRTLEDLEDGKIYNAPNKPTERIHDESVAQVELTGQPEATPKVSSVVRDQETPGLRGERNPRDITTAIPGEQTQFEAALTGFTARFQPDDEVELHLVHRLAQLTLRLNRAAKTETALTDQAHTSAAEWIDDHPGYFPDPAQHPTEILAGTWTRSAKEAILLSQYESRLSHDFARTLRQLLQLQKLRNQTQRALNLKGVAPSTEPAGTANPEPEAVGGNPQLPNEPRSPSEILAKQTHLTPPARSLASDGQVASPAKSPHRGTTPSDHPTTPQPLLNSNQTNPSPAANSPTPLGFVPNKPIEPQSSHPVK